MKTRQKLLTNEQWELIEPLLPKPRQRRDKRGRPPTPNRPCFEGILWILKTGAAWHFLRDGVSFALDLLAPAATLARSRGLAGGMAGPARSLSGIRNHNLLILPLEVH